MKGKGQKWVWASAPGLVPGLEGVAGRRGESGEFTAEDAEITEGRGGEGARKGEEALRGSPIGISDEFDASMDGDWAALL